MFFRKKPKRLYIPTAAKWYRPPRYRAGASLSRRTLNVGFASLFSRIVQGRITLLFGLATVIIIFLIAFSFVYWRIASIQIVREDFAVDSTAVEQEFQRYLGKNLLLFSPRSLLKTLHEKFPEFETLEIKKKFPHTLQLKLLRYPMVANLRAYYVLPQALPETKVDFSAAFNLNPEKPKEPEPTKQKALLNYIGQAIFDQEEDLELIIISIHGLTQPIENREQVIHPEIMQYIRETLQYFINHLNQEVKGLEYLPVAREIHIKTFNNLVIWLTTEKEYQEQLDKLKIIYEPAELNKEDLAYIDLRIKEKVIYCPRLAPCAR